MRGDVTGSLRFAPHGRGLPLVAALLALVTGCSRELPVLRDLTDDVGQAEVCRFGALSCVAGPRAAGLHGFDVPGVTRVITLPIDTSSNVYLRLPPVGRLRFEFRATDARLAVHATRPGGEDVRLFASSGPTGGWTSAEVSIDPAAGDIVRLSFMATGLAGRPPGLILLRDPTLRGPAVPAAATHATPDRRQPNVVLYLVDTLRADRLGCYGYRAPTSPRIDAFAASAIRFTHAVAQSSWTRPTTASIFTGVIPPRHGAIEPSNAIDPEVPTLPELLRAGGYATAAFVVNPVVSGAFGFARGFDRFSFFPDVLTREALFMRADRVVPRVARWLRYAPKPFFLYVHTADPHSPYVPPPRYRRGLAHDAGGFKVADLIASQHSCPNCLHDFRNARWSAPSPNAVRVLSSLYDGEVKLADAAFGRLLAALESAGRLDDTLVVFTADHGEEFLEHGGMTHGQTLYREVVDIPLIVRLPGGARGGTTVNMIAQQVDVLPTILEAAGIRPPAGLDGASLFDGTEARPREVVSHLRRDGRELLALHLDRWAFVRNLHDSDRPPVEIYDVAHDPLERRNLAGTDDALSGYADERLGGVPVHVRAGPVVEDAELDRLRALGYVTR